MTHGKRRALARCRISSEGSSPQLNLDSGFPQGRRHIRTYAHSAAIRRIAPVATFVALAVATLTPPVAAAPGPTVTFEDLPAGTKVFSQIDGVRFPTLPCVVHPSVSTTSGVRALSNLCPGSEIPSPHMRIEFTAPQTHVRLVTGLTETTTGPLRATLRARDASGAIVATHGPQSIGPGPTPIATPFEIITAERRIASVELEQEGGAYPIVIDDLHFDAVTTSPPDNVPPTVRIKEPAMRARLTGERFIFAIDVREDQRLRSATLQINQQAPVSMAFHRNGSAYWIGPVWTGSLRMGRNVLTVRAEDWGGNVGTASVIVRRVPIAGTLDLPDGAPIILPRLPGRATVPLELRETFAGSLKGRGQINIQVVGPEGVRGFGVIRDYANQRNPRLDLPIFAGPRAKLGVQDVTVRATEAASGRAIDEATFRASITPGGSIDCTNVPVYFAIPAEEFAAGLTSGIRDLLAGRTNIQPITDVTLRYEDGRVLFRQDYRVHGKKLGIPWTGTIEFTASLVPRVQGTQIEFADGGFNIVAQPPTPAGAVAAEKEFKAEFATGFAARIGPTLMERLKRDPEHPQLAAIELVLRNVYVNRQEFGVGLCVPADQL